MKRVAGMFPEKRLLKNSDRNKIVKKTGIIISIMLICTMFCACASAAADAPSPAAAEPAFTSSPSKEIKPTAATESEKTTTNEDKYLDDSWFDDVVFIGDSVTSSLETYIEQSGDLGDCLFLCRPSYSLRSAVSNEMKLQYGGVYYPIEDAILKSGQNKVFIMLGGNDFGLLTERIQGTMEYWEIVYNRIVEKNPDVTIFIESVLPMHEKSETESFNNELIDELNLEVMDFCEEKGITYVALDKYFKDKDNTLKEEYSLDHQIHINDEGIEVWIDQLKNVDNYSSDPREIK